MTGRERVWPTAKAPPGGWSTGMVCEAVGCHVAELLDAAERGIVPPPDIFNGELIWSPDTVAQIRDGRPCLPGMVPPMPPGYNRAAELQKWRRNVSRGKVSVVRCHRRLKAHDSRLRRAK